MAMIVWEHDKQLHTFDVADGNLMHRWFDLRANRWTSVALAGPKAPSSMWREPVTNPQVSVARYNSGLHVTAGAVHAWFHPAARRWHSEKLP